MIKDISFKLKEIKIDNSDIDISEKQLESILQYTQKISIKDLNSYVEQDLSDLKKKALKYIKVTENLAQKTRLLNSLYYKRRQIKNLIKKGQNNLAFELQQNTQKIRQIILTQSLLIEGIKETALFTKELQEKLGKSSELIYVHQSKNGNEVRMYRIDKIEDIIKIQKGHANQLEARLSVTLEQLKQLEKHGKGSQIKINLQQAKNLDKAYSAILQRYNTYNYKRKHLILWQMRGNHPKWHGLWRSETGTLAQSYANVVLNRKFDKFVGDTGTTRQTDIEFFASLVEQAVGTFGGLQGDVEYLNQNSYIASAIKSGSASPQGLLETVKLAYAILNLPENIDEVKFLQVMEKYNYKRQQKSLIKKFTNQQIKELKNQLI